MRPQAEGLPGTAQWGAIFAKNYPRGRNPWVEQAFISAKAPINPDGGPVTLLHWRASKLWETGVVARLLRLSITRPNSLNLRVLAWMVGVTVAAFSSGCHGGGAVSTKTTVPQNAKPVVRDATQDELLDRYNRVAQGVKTVNATVELKPTAGSRYSGLIEEYHEVKAFLLAARPAEIRVIGQAPVVGTTVFDMTSDGETFRVWVPSKNKFLVGQVAAERASNKPIENLRPQHLLDALLWPEIRKEETVLFEEFNDETARYYVLTVLRGGYRTEILRKIWFDRADLQVSRLQGYGPKGLLLSDVHFSDWQPLLGDPEHPSAPANHETGWFPRVVRIDRPHDDYRLDLQITKVTLNTDIPGDRFKLEQPSGSELVTVGDDAEDKQR
jgi:outer membrane lipoprotein-sorting protein